MTFVNDSFIFIKISLAIISTCRLILLIVSYFKPNARRASFYLEGVRYLFVAMIADANPTPGFKFPLLFVLYYYDALPNFVFINIILITKFAICYPLLFASSNDNRYKRIIW